MEPIHYFNRYTDSIESEAIYGEGFLRWAYGNPLGRLSVELVAKRWFFSHWYGWRMNQPKSRTRIKPFIEDYGLDAAEFAKPVQAFTSFNDFFSRQLKPSARPMDPLLQAIVFPADGRHLGFPNLSQIKTVFTKNQHFNLVELFQSQSQADRYAEGTAVLSRLCPTDYHRFHFPTAGIPSAASLIDGPLYSVSPLALRRRLAYLWRNKRMITELATESAGTITIVEFGATNVGSIHQTFSSNQEVDKGEEKGYFAFGGSATMTFFEPGKVLLAPDLVEQSQEGRELYARMGDTMASVCE